MRKLFVVSLTFLLLTGCGVKPFSPYFQNVEREPISKEERKIEENKESFFDRITGRKKIKDVKQEEDVKKKLDEIKLDEPEIVKIKIPKGVFELSLPKFEVRDDREIDIRMKGKVSEILDVLSQETGLPVFIQALKAGNSTAEKEFLISYKGKVSGFFNYLSELTGYFYSLKENGVVVKEKERFLVFVPAYSDLAKVVKESLERLGARDVVYDSITSSIIFTADYEVFKKIREHLRDLKENMSMVSMRVVLLSVSYDSSKTRGIDWGQLGYFLQTRMLSNTSNGTSFSSAGITTSNSTSMSSGFKTGLQVLFNSQGASFIIDGKNFNLMGFLGLLESFGKYDLLQNFHVMAFSGSKGKIEVVTETPYIESITQTMAGTTGAITTGTQTARAKSGVVMEILPYFYRKNEVINLDLKVSVDEVLRFLNLNAGNLGMLTQPEIARKNVETKLNLKPGQVVILGGLIYDRNQKDTSGLPLDSYLTKKYSEAKVKSELIILVRPVVYVFEEDLEG